MTPRPRAKDRDQHGSGSVLTLITVGLVLMAFLVVIVVGSYLVADHRAVAAADQAALSGARAHGSPSAGHTACEVAGRSAELNGARVVECRLSGDRVDYVVQVVVAVDVGVVWPGLPTEVQAGAQAGRMSG